MAHPPAATPRLHARPDGGGQCCHPRVRFAAGDCDDSLGTCFASRSTTNRERNLLLLDSQTARGGVQPLQTLPASHPTQHHLEPRIGSTNDAQAERIGRPSRATPGHRRDEVRQSNWRVSRCQATNLASRSSHFAPTEAPLHVSRSSLLHDSTSSWLVPFSVSECAVPRVDAGSLYPRDFARPRLRTSPSFQVVKFGRRGPGAGRFSAVRERKGRCHAAGNELAPVRVVADQDDKRRPALRRRVGRSGASQRDARWSRRGSAAGPRLADPRRPAGTSMASAGAEPTPGVNSRLLTSGSEGINRAFRKRPLNGCAIP